ncbi:MAG: N-6 DNA methylase, partial [Saprospiraceae bacterium]|nr:N-6 DNA methylase [Saprospiraceae bacterium]
TALKSLALEKVKELVARFDEQIDSYKKEYNETQTRQDFINPFFEALGWDMTNKGNLAEAYREVIHEDKVLVDGVTKAPDYSFRLMGGKRLFYLEAKKPSVKVKDEIPPAYQLRRYGWSSKMPISIITDFEEFGIYDCTKRPEPSDKAHVARIKYITYKEYAAEWDFIWDTFSRERVPQGAFDKFVQSDTHKKGTATVDKEFLLSLDEWRKSLASTVSWNNQSLSEDEINFVVQQTIDRIIFLRIAEERHVEPFGNLRACLDGKDFYKNLVSLFVSADQKYNSGLFDFKKDTLSKSLTVDNKAIRNIIEDLYYPKCPYEFSVLPVEILGSAYEQFLGKQIKIDKAHRARIEDKPEVRKAGGVYYTPQYIVDYIVDHTVGTLIRDKSPKEVSDLRIVDPACGSGSFLLGAYQYLLDWHKAYYKEHTPAHNTKTAQLTPDGYLTTAEKKRILLNNIYGVDIDTNAVEVTKLSLLLKCLEGETEASIAHQMSIWNERILPTLDENIKSGNSLIDTDYYDSQLDFGEDRKIKPFNWEKGFPEVFKRKDKGFDVVIGNPPYVRIQTLIENNSLQLTYLGQKFKTASKGNYDIYVLFVEKSISLINNFGLIGFILPHKFFTSTYGESTRKLLNDHNSLLEIVHFGAQQIFENATTYTCILIFTKLSQSPIFKFKQVKELKSWIYNQKSFDIEIEKNNLSNGHWTFSNKDENRIKEKIIAISNTLEENTDRIFQGIKTGADKVFILRQIKYGKKTSFAYSNELSTEIEIESSLLRKLIKGGNSKPYFISDSDLMILFPYFKNKNGRIELIPFPELDMRFPLAAGYLLKNERMLLERDGGKLNSKFWYGFSRNQA